MDLVPYIIIGIILIGIWMILGDTGKKEEPHTKETRIRDEDVDAHTVLFHLERFSPTIRAERKNGFTEKDVQDELEIYLKGIFYSVTREHAIEGKNVKRIDFDLGNGAIGVEVKLAEAVLKEGENDRVIGQMQKYIQRKYNKGNMVIALVGYAHHTRNTIIHEMKDDILRGGSNFVFMKAKEIK